MRFRALPVTSLEDATVDFEQLQGLLFAQNPAQAYRNAAFTLTAGTWVKIPLDAATDNPGGNFDVTTNHRYNAPVAGRYWVAGQAAALSTAADQYNLSAIYKNGAQVLGGSLGVSRAAGWTVATAAGGEVNCAAGDYIELWANAGAAIALVAAAANNYLSVVRVA